LAQDDDVTYNYELTHAYDVTQDDDVTYVYVLTHDYDVTYRYVLTLEMSVFPLPTMTHLLNVVSPYALFSSSFLDAYDGIWGFVVVVLSPVLQNIWPVSMYVLLS
jgi:hypothetical protein